jgi:hypothetical protein
MKNLFLILAFIIPMAVNGQKTQSVDVLGHSFAVGDTIQLTTGTMPNGDFMCVSSTSLLLANSDGTVDHISSASYNNMKFIIKKIKTIKFGMNTSIGLFIKAGLLNLRVDATIAITKKEIVLK